MKISTGYSKKTDTQEAVQEACTAFRDSAPEFILFFSDRPRFAAFSELLYYAFPSATILGASTHASFSPEGLSTEALNITAFSRGLHVSAGVIREISRHPDIFYQSTITNALNGLDLDKVQNDNTCCFVLNPAGTACEEMVLDALDDSLKEFNIPIVGGSASSELCLNGSVSLNGSVYTNSSVFALLQLEKGSMQVYLENIYKPMGIQYTVTKSDIMNRTIYALDGKPAADVLCQALQVPFEELASALALHPFGRLPSGRLYIDEIERINRDRSITTYCRILEDSQISLLELDDFPTVMQQTFAKIHADKTPLEFSILINCFSRVNLYLQKNWMNEFHQQLTRSLGSYLGFTSHGEQLGDFNLNLSLLLLCFKGTKE